MKILSRVTIVCLLLTACAGQTPLPAPTPTDRPAATDCDLQNVLPQVDTLLAGSEYEADYLTINHQLTLSIWLVDPGIDPAATDETLDANARHAFVTGARLAHQMVSKIPCARKLFAAVNPMIVDRGYNGWYIDIIPMQAIPAAGEPTDDELTSSIEQSGLQITFLRQTPPRSKAQAAAGESCSWADAHAKINEEFSSSRRNVSAYLIVGYQAIPGSAGSEPVYAQVQWDTATPAEAQQAAVLATLQRLTGIVACLNPPVDRLETYVVDTQGRLVVYALVPSTVIQAKQAALDPAQFTLIFFEGQ